MSTLKNRLTILVSVAIVLVLLVAAVAFILIDANDIKQRLDTELVAKTGQHLRIDGDVSLQIFPLAVKITRAQLRSEGNKQPWFRVERVAGQIDVMRLFSGELVIDSFTIHKPQIDLDKAKFPESDNKAGNNKAGKKVQADKQEKPLLIGVRQVKISDGTLNWGKTAKDGQLDINSFTASNKAPGKPVDLRFDLRVHSPEVAHVVPVKGSVRVDFSKTGVLKVKPVSITLDQTRLDGKVTINTKKATHIDFDLGMDQLDVDRYTSGKSNGKPAASQPAARSSKNKSGNKAGAPDTIITGKLALKKLSVTGLNISNTKTKLRFANNILKLTDFSSHVSDGTVKGNVTVNLQAAQPVISMDQELRDIKVGKLLKDLKIYDHFSGKGNVSLKLSTRGNDLDPLLKNLDGIVGFKLTESSFNDTDLLATAIKYKQIYATLKGRQVKEETASSKRVYDNVSGSFNFKNGMGATNDILISRKDEYITGKGTIGPGHDHIDIYLMAGKQRADQNTDRAIPLRVRRKLSDIKVRLDEKAVKKAVKKEAKKKVKKKAEKKLKESIKRSLDRYLNR